MKKIVLSILAITVSIGFAFAQKADDIIFSFTKKENEKIMQKKDDGSRYVNFIVLGIKSDDHASAFVKDFKSSDYVVEFTLSSEFESGQRNAYLCVRPEAKLEQLRDLLKFNNVAFVKVNEEYTAVTKIKSKAEQKAEKKNQAH